MFRRNYARKELAFPSTGPMLPSWNALAPHSAWIQQALVTLRRLDGVDRVAVWLEPQLGAEDHASPVVFQGDVWESDGGAAPVEWTRLSGDALLPRELLDYGKSVEYRSSESGNESFLGVLLGLQHALWVPVNGRKLLRGLLLVGTRNKEKPIARTFVEQIAAQLALLLQFEDERYVSANREADLQLWRNVQLALSSAQPLPLLLKIITESCTKTPQAGGVGTVFALIGKLQSGLPIARPAAASQEERLLVLAECGDPAWAHSLAQGPLETLWRQSLREGRVVGADSHRLPLARDISRIVAIPIETKSGIHEVLLAGIPRRYDALEILERLELRALLVAQVMEAEEHGQAEARGRTWQKTLLDFSPESVLIVNQQGILLGMSRGAREQLRFLEQDVSPMTELQRFAELFRPRQWEEINCWITRAFGGDAGNLAQSMQAELRNGSAVEVRRLAISSREFVAVNIELAQPERATRGIKELEAEFRQTIEWLQEGVVVFDELGGIRAMNSRCHQILGITPDDLRGIHNFDGLVDRVSRNAAESEEFARNWRQLAAQGGTESREELAMEWPVPQLIERSMRQLRDESGKPLGRIEVYQEFTARKIFQSRMVQAEKMASLGQRATSIVHELANPLTTILGSAQRLVLRDPAAGSSAEVLRILEEAERASSILRQLLHLSRETHPLRRHVFLHDLAERTIGLQKMALAQSSIELRLESDGSLPPVDADFAQLQQVLINLMQNAQQAIEQSGKGSAIGLRIGRSGDDHVRIEVWDDGPGIPAAVQGRIFDPFFTTKPAGAGTGLGLSIALGFVRQNGGTLNYLVPREGGSSFVMEFRVAEGFSAPLRHEIPTDKRLLHLPKPPEPIVAIGADHPLELAQRVLVVEDEPTVAALIADVLRDAGLRVDVMLDSQSALQQVEHESYDLLVCDLKMPGVDGQRFYRTMLERHHPMQGKVLFVTGDIVAPRSQEFLARHHLPHVAKPFRMEELLHAVQELLGPNPPGEAVKVVAIPKLVSGNG